MSALGCDFKAVATPPNNLEFEDDPEEVRIDILENNIEFGEPLDDEDEIDN
ncbi:hypothetical protein [Burkholderia sp. THE68]|uniref:hypothetical protein n=1 Tax=Burkholderia sp. THE68 TaxID=758782 RepID=UPI001389BE8E|nr:hypothetical protein [Burkholderia sp. THE68]